MKFNTSSEDDLSALIVAMRRMAGIAKEMERDQSSLGPARANIISKGMIYSTDHGYLDFSVPLFAEYLRRRGE